MIKKLLFLSFLMFMFLAAKANTVDPAKTVDPEKEQNKKNVVAKKPLVVDNNNEANEFLVKGQTIRLTEQDKEKKETPSAKPTTESNKVGEDVQSFNFLYYIIHQFKFSDFVTE